MDDRLKERIRRGDVNRSLDKETEETIRGNRIKVYCKTCRIIFLEMDLDEYNRLHSWDGDDEGQINDKWYIETGIHWFEHQGHEIIQDTEVAQHSINDIWRLKYKEELSRGNSLERILEFLYEHRERVKDRPI